MSSVSKSMDDLRETTRLQAVLIFGGNGGHYGLEDGDGDSVEDGLHWYNSDDMDRVLAEKDAAFRILQRGNVSQNTLIERLRVGREDLLVECCRWEEKDAERRATISELEDKVMELEAEVIGLYEDMAGESI